VAERAWCPAANFDRVRCLFLRLAAIINSNRAAILDLALVGRIVSVASFKLLGMTK
jgi:hypothetical protein